MKYTVEIELDVEYVYSKGHPATLEEPGEPEHAEILAITCNGINVDPLVESLGLINDIATAALEDHREQMSQF